MTKNNDTIALSMKSFKESFKVIDWVKSRKKKTIKKYPVLNQKLTFQGKRKRAQIIFDYNNHVKIVLNFDYTPVTYTSLNKMNYFNTGK